MADVLVENQSLVDIADAIRLKLSTQDTYKPSEMAAAIETIEGGGITPTGTINITENGTVNVTQYASANVNVPTGGADLGTKSITANGNYSASSDNLDGYSSVSVNVPNTYGSDDEGKVVSNGALVAQTSDTVTQNGTVDTTLINSLLVNVSGGGGSSNLETGSVTLASDLSLTTSAQAIPNLTLGFQPDFFLLLPDRTSFEGRESYSGGLWGVMAIKKSWCAPFANSTTKTPETVTGDYVFFVSTALFANTSITCGQGIASIGLLDTSFYARYSVNSDGTIGVGRYSSGATKMFAGKYNYIAVKF